MVDATHAEDFDHIGQWLLNNAGKQGTPEFTEMANAYKAMRAQMPALPTAPVAPAVPGRPQPPMSLEAIRAIPDEAARSSAYNTWADTEEAKATEADRQGPISGSVRSLNDTIRMLAKGVPGGSYLDELNAWTASKMPEALGGVPYEQAVAQQRARDRRIYAEEPIAATVANVGGGVASAPLTTLRGAGLGANIALDTAIGAAHGSGEGEGSLLDRAGNAVQGGLVSGGLSTAIRAPMAAWGRRYSTVTPQVAAAADTLNTPTPFFVRAADPRVQALGRQTAQERPGSALAQSWDATRQGTTHAGENIVQGVTGAPSSTAPNVVGSRVQGGMENAARDMTGQINTIARDIETMVPPNVRADPTATRNQLGQVMASRALAFEDPAAQQAGLQPAMSLATEPGGVTWPQIQAFTQRLGDIIGDRRMAPTGLTDSEMRSLYRSSRGVDQPNMAQNYGGPALRDRYTQAVETQNQLSGMRQTIANAVEGSQPEQLVNMAANAATVRGGGTRLDQLGMMWRSLDPAQQQQMAAGILAKIQNDARGAPATVAARLAEIPEQVRNTLWPPGTPIGNQVAALQTLSERVGAVDRAQHVGTAKTMSPMLGTAGGAAGLGTLGYLAHQLGLGPEAAALGAALFGGRMLNRAAIRPALLQHGIRPEIVNAIDALIASGVRQPIGQ